MDIQKLADAVMAEARVERLSNSEQLMLGELKLKLDAVKDKSKPIEFDFGMKPSGASSWRGSYCELGLEYSKIGGGDACWNGTEVEWESENGDYQTYKNERFSIPENPATQDFLDMLKALTDKEMVGYKGGDFRMHKNVAVYLGNYGESSVENYKDSASKYGATVAPIDVIEDEEKVIIVTAEVSY